MTLDIIKLSIATPSEPILPGRGFYQVEEDTLHVQVGPFSHNRRFFSWIESPNVRLDFDRQGRLIFIELATARRHWQTDPALTPPDICEPADIRWLDFRESVTEPVTVANPERNLVCISFKENGTPLNYHLADSLVCQVDRNYNLTSIWINDIVTDRAGKRIRAFRKKSRHNKSYYA